MRIIQEALTFDDVLLAPAYSEVLPREVSLATAAARDIELNIPVMSAAMDTVTESALAIALAKEGGLGVIHKNMTPELQARHVAAVKKYASGVVSDPITVNPEESVREVLDTFYTWPLMLPRELVYLFRTLVLLEGIGAAYDAHFDSFAVFRRVVGAHRGEILRTAGREPVAIAKDVWSETSGLVRSARELLVRAERENLRVRVHPRDIQGIERSLTLLGRRLLLSIFAASTAVISAIIYISLDNVWVLAAGLLAALVLFLVVLVVPAHLLDNPLRHARGLGSRRWQP